MEWPIFVAGIVGIFFGIILAFFLLRGFFKLELERWKQEVEEKIRQETLGRSRAVLKGKIGEQMAPLFPEFKYNPADARFIGSPIDYIVFDGYTQVKDGTKDERAATPIKVIFMDVKKGEAAKLKQEQQRIKEAVEQKRVRWETLRVK